MCNDVHGGSDGHIIYNRQDGCLDTSIFLSTLLINENNNFKV